MLGAESDLSYVFGRVRILRKSSFILAALLTIFLVSCMERSEDATSRQRLSDFQLLPSDYGWTGSFPVGPHMVFGKEIYVHIETRAIPDEPKALPPVSISQATLVKMITPALPMLLKRVEEEMVGYNKHDPDFRDFISDPHIWLSSDEDDGQSWTFVIERTDAPGFGYHAEFKGTNFVEIWAGS
jgi:hypothetical protein